MNDFISRKAVLHEAEKVSLRDRNYRTYGNVVRSIPAADVVERKSARWKGAGLGDYYCSLCNETYSIGAERVNDWHFCPNCGAKMDGKSADYAPAKPYDLLYEEGGPDA